ncbi:MAG: hypothetical protein HQL02_04255 [Nitrospirae bacterium]|nr:hypothetical protein [Nitrospirota bacterium]
MSKEATDRPAPDKVATDRPAADRVAAERAAPERGATEKRPPEKRSPERWASKSDYATNKKYISLMQTILAIENRLVWSELAYLTLNIAIVFFSIGLLSYAAGKRDTHIIYISVLFILVIGEFLCVYWIIASMKIQMKLKLRYFQARFLERKQGIRGETFFSDESSYFNPSIGYVESPDRRERVDYPSTGAIRMDGFAGAAKPRHLSWVMASVIFFIYIALILWMLPQMLKAS